MKKFVIEICGLPDGTPTPWDGKYVKEFDFEAHNGRGSLNAVADKPEDALLFNTMSEAWDFWQTQPKCRPIRPDGKPNKPLTATNVGIIPVEV